MKITCDFCQTEYSLDRAPNSPVRCAVCGHVWHAAAPSRRSAFLVVIAAATALLAAIVFTIVAITHHRASADASRPLVASVTEITTTTDDAGVSHFVVHGTVVNQSGEIYGVPDLIITSRDANGNPIAHQKFMPSATLLDAGGHVSFTHTLAAPTYGVKKITVELADMGDE